LPVIIVLKLASAQQLDLEYGGYEPLWIEEEKKYENLVT
jgi:hypothetical protein